jgi:MoxR-like ATPase
MENQEQIFENRINLDVVTEAVDKIKNELSQIVFGQEEVIDLILIGLLSDGHVLIEGVPGVAKTMMSKLMGKVLNLSFKRVQFTPDLMPSDVLGTSVFNPKTLDFEYKQGPVFGNIVLVDEINRAPAKTQAALFELMEERQITIDGKTYPMDTPFIVLATQNPIEQEGTYRLPEAQLDRFLFRR